METLTVSYQLIECRCVQYSFVIFHHSSRSAAHYMLLTHADYLLCLQLLTVGLSLCALYAFPFDLPSRNQNAIPSISMAHCGICSDLCWGMSNVLGFIKSRDVAKSV
jgi:hypothetical protein